MDPFERLWREERIPLLKIPDLMQDGEVEWSRSQAARSGVPFDTAVHTRGRQKPRFNAVAGAQFQIRCFPGLFGKR